MSHSEHIHVSLRFRPLSPKEIDENDKQIWQVSHDTVSLKPEFAGLLQDARRTALAKAYSYNRCFSSKDTNQQVYEAVVRRVVMSSLEGFNGTVFAYGQTGSGKTYTMMGTEGQDLLKGSSRKVEPTKGIIELALDDLFVLIGLSENKTFYLEIYNEQVYDLLSDQRYSILSVCEDPVKGFYVRSLTSHPVNSKEDVLKFIELGEASRRYRSTAMNHHSSRSHTIFKLQVNSVALNDRKDAQGISTESLLNFVDLAGSERISGLQESPKMHQPRLMTRTRRTATSSAGPNDSMITEGKHINTSLFYLCQVIHRLSDKSKAEHVPYRNSNLTKILRSSLGGNALTCIMCTATPTISQFEMTLGTLRFAGIAKTVTNTVAANVKSDIDVEVLSSYQKDIDNLRQELDQIYNGGKAKAEEAAQNKKILEERVSKLTKMLFSKSNEVESLEKTHRKSSGDLMSDSRLQQNNENSLVPGKTQLKFDSAGQLAAESLTAMRRRRRQVDSELEKMRNIHLALSNSKTNLKQKLRQSVDLCSQLEVHKKSYKDKAKVMREKVNGLSSRLALLENFNGLQSLDQPQLLQLEQLYSKGLDRIKEAKFKMGLLQPVTEAAQQLLSDPPESDLDSSLEFESSFYHSKRSMCVE
mmetsp:Transcript_985/g.2455  ORF Transcript_985/g.2455 Transcript_985/m.2455 type:complete len:641 (+) Transcript_985:468-2390(+)